MVNNEKSLTSVLVVDDNDVNRLILVNMLELFQIHAEEASDGRTAIYNAERKVYDLILVDHIMPGMNGIKTTSELRKTAINKDTLIIIALTAEVTEKTREMYLEAKANDVYEKPLELKNLAILLQTYGLINQTELYNQSFEAGTDDDNQLIKSIIETIDEINYEAGLKYALGNPRNYVNILEVSLKDLKSCIHMINGNYDNILMDELTMGVHKLKNILVNIGALKLYEESSVLERVFKDLNKKDTNDMYRIFVTNLINFEERLTTALDHIQVLGRKSPADQTGSVMPLSKQEYEQSLVNAIYYIRRYEYEAIIKELTKMINQGQPCDKEELQIALSDIRCFDYESALSRIIRIKNKTDQ